MDEPFSPASLKNAKTKFFSLEGLFEELKEEHTEKEKEGPQSTHGSPKAGATPDQPLVEDGRLKSVGAEMKWSDSKEMFPQIVVSDEALDDHAVTAESFSKPEKIYRKKLLVDTSTR